MPVADCEILDLSTRRVWLVELDPLTVRGFWRLARNGEWPLSIQGHPWALLSPFTIDLDPYFLN